MKRRNFVSFAQTKQCHEGTHQSGGVGKINEEHFYEVLNYKNSTVVDKQTKLDRTRTKMSDASFDWEIPEFEMNSKLGRIDLGAGCHKFQSIIDSTVEVGDTGRLVTIK
ncbi:hypothetical protein CEXT_554411 [Caerostris extrusa]|uniref:Uncharacterized protein n=1 Tax=Caerostris extrusa TaxID=172846 RepID=A0AAV4NPM1_CAEEX|nr:hypothetical protein CEXT_554411 [Caerostris extrusa]